MADGKIFNFRPAGYLITQLVSGSATSATIALTSHSLRANDGWSVRLHNTGNETAFIEFGTSSSVSATMTSSMPLPAGGTEVFDVRNEITHIAVITSGGSVSTVFITGGYGS